MFESLRQAFREAVHNFQSELHRDEVPEAADRLLRAMEREFAGVRAELDRLSLEVERTRAEARGEEEEARTCVRREELARRIGDEETARIARDYALRHLEKKTILAQKAEVLERELGARQAESDSMQERLKEARLRRDALAASAGRTQAHTRLREAESLFGEMDRMAERIRDLEAHAGAAEELGGMDLDGSGTTGAKGSSAPSDLDLELEALKRRMADDS